MLRLDTNHGHIAHQLLMHAHDCSVPCTVQLRENWFGFDFTVMSVVNEESSWCCSTAYLAFQDLDQSWCEPTVRNVQKQALVLPMLHSAAQLQQGCLSGSLSGFVSNTPFNIKANCAWRVFQELCAVIVNLHGCVCINGVTLSADNDT